MTYYVYLIKAINTEINKSYVGYTTNLHARIEKHNNNKGAKATKGYNWKLIYSKKFNSKKLAMSYEYKFKKNYYLRNKIIKNFRLNEKI